MQQPCILNQQRLEKKTLQKKKNLRKKNNSKEGKEIIMKNEINEDKKQKKKERKEESAISRRTGLDSPALVSRRRPSARYCWKPSKRAINDQIRSTTQRRQPKRRKRHTRG